MPPPNSSLTNEDRAALLRLARATVEARCAGQSTADLERSALAEGVSLSPCLRAPAGVFVTLHRRSKAGSSELRGCVGFVETSLPLYRAVIDTAAAAAAEDPRFSPVLPEELSELEIEISVLSPPALITLEQIQIGVHGLVVTNGSRRGLLLPQVAVERNWSAQRFLEETCRKAGLASDAWRHGASVEAFEADLFGENSGADRDSPLL